jgi:HD-GYP domain-containing protein (c-di-GMP phosphodiesterase class II)
MSSSFEFSRSRGVDVRGWSRRAETAQQRDDPAPVHMARYLPLSVLTTGLVIVLPAMLASAIVPRGTPLLIAALVGLAVASSVAFASAGAAVWKRQPRSRDLVFAELLLWGWLRRYRTERRLAQARDLHAAARKAGPAVSAELLASLGRLLDARETCRDGHSQRVARHAERIARAMRLPKAEVKRIRTAAAAHDVGKLHTPADILASAQPLSDMNAW